MVLFSNHLLQALHRIHGASVLVTGGTGLIGLNLVSALSKFRESAGVPFDIYATSRQGPFAGSRRFLEGVKKLHVGELTDKDFVDTLPTVDFVIHGATYGQPAKFMEKSLETILLNTWTTSELLRKSRAGFLFLSSSEVYSGAESGPYRENQIGTTTTMHPRAAYIEGKRCGEVIALQGNHSARRSDVVRLSLAYGPGTRLNDNRVLNELILRGLQEKSVVLKGGHDQIRTYLFVEDAVEYLLGILMLGEGDIYNVGGRNPISLDNLAQIVAGSLGLDYRRDSISDFNTQTGAPEFVGLNMDKTDSLVPGINLTSIQKGIRETVDWYSDILE